mgnify:CR=1 FL=1
MTHLKGLVEGVGFEPTKDVKRSTASDKVWVRRVIKSIGLPKLTKNFYDPDEPYAPFDHLDNAA